MNTWKRKLLALLSVPLLAVPSAVGVYAYLEPESGSFAAGLAAAGFEVLYVGVNILIISSPELRRYARNVSLGAVVTAVLMNTIAHYSAPAFNVLELFLSLIASAPLATLAYAVSVLLHRLSEEAAQQTVEEVRLHVSLAQTEAEIARLTADLAQARDQLARVEATAAQSSEQAAQRQAELEQSVRGAAEMSRELAQALRAKEAEIAELRESLAAGDPQLADLRQSLASREAEIVSVRETLADHGAALAAARDEVATLREQLAKAELESATEARRLADISERLASREQEIAKLRESLASAQDLARRLRDQPAPIPTRQAQIAYAVRETARGRSQLDVARELDMPEATLRGWLKAQTNGHHVEV